jgi:hypothetical protein
LKQPVVEWGGLLSKKGASFPWSWKERWFQLRDYTLSYEKYEGSGDILGTMDLREWYIDQEHAEKEEHGIRLVPINKDVVEAHGHSELKLLAADYKTKRDALNALHPMCHSDPDQLDQYREKMAHEETTLGGLHGHDAESIDSSITMIMFIGGCTKSEVAGIRHLAARENQMYVVATTGIISGKTMMRGMVTPYADAGDEI